MYTTDDELTPSESGYTTPPLSPAKTISTEGWSSPRTPGSPRKIRSCLFFRNVGPEHDDAFFTPPPSPTKLKFASQLGTLSIPEILSPTRDPISSALIEESPAKRTLPLFDSLPSQRSLTAARLTNRSSPAAVDHTETVKPSCIPSLDFSRPSSPLDGRNKRRRSYRSSSDSSIDALVARYATPPTTPTEINASHCSDQLVKDSRPPARVVGTPLRSSSSPLRPSQWVSRGGLLSSPRKSQVSTPDRFIHCRRPPAVTRESFELNKPIEREQISHRGHRAGGDPFSRRVRRSDRLSAELRGLREAYTVIARRTIGSRPSPYSRLRSSSPTTTARQISAGAVWNVGGSSAVSDTVAAVSTGNGGMLGSGTMAPLYTSTFLNRADPEAELEAYERRLALALDVDQTDRILYHTPLRFDRPGTRSNVTQFPNPHVWRDSAWAHDDIQPLLDAPQLRDDYYCTLLAYSSTAKYLAVGLGNFVHLWSERDGVKTPESINSVPTDSEPDTHHITSLDFSSTQGGQAILAVGRADGRIGLWSPFGFEPRFNATQPKPVSCVSFRPTTVQRPSLRDRAITVATEELLVGDEVGHIYLYSIEWPSETQSALFGWHGAMTLLARMTIHTQQICGLAWSATGDMFASGGNDNNCFLFESKRMLQSPTNSDTSAILDVREGPTGESIYTVTNRSSPVLHLPHTASKQKWVLNAAVKAIAFCPWHSGLVAVGGGSNDRCIHFYHTRSGACLATIDCAAQVTSLVWSQTRREIAATFGFAQPEHPYRIAVFAWPSCEQVVAVPWWDENRALCAVAFPGGPMSMPGVGSGERAAGEDELWGRHRSEDGCLVVAASDMAIRFHEIWTGGRVGNSIGGLLGDKTGLLGSDILDVQHGIERPGTTIR
ncbi:meiosis-specific APC/C activator protein AMA1 [Boeremia exigua]|uniref:meiosis-specific APC/C activator protein AMA1 n=1 Tax=Boeremia exigua TaxID=749465 RepID=UPI001E8CDE06|nr:meiosis-specific APC/C activator protein AMA1 [Boeremia exigua]KAH6618866.1 meiosis-specific APC/C activator protein AMA1 [Boeremia exigua]